MQKTNRVVSANQRELTLPIDWFTHDVRQMGSNLPPPSAAQTHDFQECGNLTKSI